MLNISDNIQPRNLRLSAYENSDKYVSFEYQTFFEWYKGSKIITSKKRALFLGHPVGTEESMNMEVSSRYYCRRPFCNKHIRANYSYHLPEREGGKVIRKWYWESWTQKMDATSGHTIQIWTEIIINDLGPYVGPFRDSPYVVHLKYRDCPYIVHFKRRECP